MSTPLLEKIEADFRESLKTSDKTKLSVLRLVKASIKNKEIEKGSPLKDDEIIDVLSSLAKQRRESIDEFKRAQRHDLVDKEQEELQIIQSYMPEQLSEAELVGLIQGAIQESAATSVRDMGKVMKILMPRIKGRADGKVVNRMVREILQGK